MVKYPLIVRFCTASHVHAAGVAQQQIGAPAGMSKLICS
jgi:hypothetical protein